MINLRSLPQFFALLATIPCCLLAESPAPKSRAEMLGIAHLPKVEVSVAIYEVKGEPVDTLEPFDLEALQELVKESWALASVEAKKLDKGHGVFYSTKDVLKGGAWVLSAPTVLVVASKREGWRAATMSAMQELYADSQGTVSDPETYTGEEELRKLLNGVETTLQVWQDAPTGDLVVEVHATVSTFEGFLDIQVAEPDGSSTPVKIPLVDTTNCDGVVTLKDGETKVFTWRENMTEQGKSLIVATVTATIKGKRGD